MPQEQHYDESDLGAIRSAHNMDADASLFFARQLEHVKTKTYDKKYPALSAQRVMPVSTEVNPGAQTITYGQYEGVGMAKIIANYATDLPRVDTYGKQTTAKVKSLGDSYAYSIQDVRSAMMAGIPLDQRKASVARQAIEVLINRIAYFGEPSHGLVGLLTHPNVTKVVLPTDGTGSGSKLATKTPDQVIRDLNKLARTPASLTKGVEVADTILIAPDVYAYISGTPRSATTDTTILKFFLDNSPNIKAVIPIEELAGAGAGGTDVAIAYTKDPDKFTLEIPQAFEQLPPQPKGLEFEVPCHARCAGVIIYFPLSIAKAEGV